jgi:RNA polymerase sigma-70 factor (ECF subfamily)
METDIEDAREVYVSEDALGQLELEYLYEIIQDLPPGYQLVFNLYAIEGYSHKEIGERMGITESTSRSQYTRARSLLMKKICEDRMESNIYKDAI